MEINLVIFNQDIYDFFKEFNKISWYLIKIFYNFKRSLVIFKKYIDFDKKKLG